jgi:hypothetical protein
MVYLYIEIIALNSLLVFLGFALFATTHILVFNKEIKMQIVIHANDFMSSPLKVEQ